VQDGRLDEGFNYLTRSLDASRGGTSNLPSFSDPLIMLFQVERPRGTNPH
jgi:hypothetical protein